MLLERRLNLFEHIAQLLFNFSAHHRRILTIQTIHNMRYVLIILVKLQLLQNLANLGRLQCPIIHNALLLELEQNRVIHLRRNLRAFFGLELREPFIEMVDALVGVIGYLTWRILVARLV